MTVRDKFFKRKIPSRHSSCVGWCGLLGISSWKQEWRNGGKAYYPIPRYGGGVVVLGKVLTCLYEMKKIYFCVTVGVEEEESSEDLLKTGHLTQLLEANLAAEVESLCVEDVVGGLQRLLTHVRSLCDSCEPVQLQVPATAALHDTCCTFHALCLSFSNICLFFA